MPDEKHRTEDSLNESRILVLGVQVLLSFQFICALEPLFDTLTTLSRYFDLVGLGLLLLSLCLLIAPVPYHQMVFAGHDNEDLQHFATFVITLALMPFAGSLGIDMFIAAERTGGRALAIWVGAAAIACAILFWYGLEAAASYTRHNPPLFGLMKFREFPIAMQQVHLNPEQRLEHVLLEARVVLPGAQALLGFQFVGAILSGFEKLPASSRYVHLVALALVTLSTILLMMPAAYHRIVERGRATEQLFRLASNAVVASLIPLSLGICCDFFVVARSITQSLVLAATASTAMALCFYVLWFGLSFYRRLQFRRAATFPAD